MQYSVSTLFLQMGDDGTCRTEFDGYDEEETVKVVFLGNQSPVKCELTQAAMECGQEELEKRMQEAMTDAHAKYAFCSTIATLVQRLDELEFKCNGTVFVERLPFGFPIFLPEGSRSKRPLFMNPLQRFIREALQGSIRAH